MEIFKFLCFFCAVISLLTYFCFRTEVVCTNYQQVVAVGGCDKYGYCGVKYEDGHFGHEAFPVTGQIECVQKTLRIKNGTHQ